MNQTDRDLAYLESVHKMGAMMGMTDADIVKAAKTAGDMDPEAMKQYLAKYEPKAVTV